MAAISSAKKGQESFPFYRGEDLGVTWSPEKTTFRVWAPTAQTVVVKIYEKGQGGIPLATYGMHSSRGGTWALSVESNLENLYYTVQAQIDNTWKNEVPDPYVKAVGVNGDRGMIINFENTNPDGWLDQRRFKPAGPQDAIIWEIHVRDFSIHPSAGSKFPGKFLAFSETETFSPEGFSTGILHLKELGITHVHLLPVFDYQTVDESRLEQPQYNWGYDPKNYNVPEGSYSTDPYDGRVRIREFKQLVQALHDSGIGVIMDVVYNHVYDAPSSSFEQLSPGYFFRYWNDGSLADGSGCGNETASERPMVRKFIIDSVKFWATEYRIDGFRFDLMGLHDIDTMNLVRSELTNINPDIIIYGEGWVGGQSPLPMTQRAIKENVGKLHDVAVFSDDIRDAIRGKWSVSGNPGFMAGQKEMKETIKFGVVASTKHPQINYGKLYYSKKPYADSPLKTITYVTCHDNPVLWDRIGTVCPECSETEKIDLQKFANAIVLTSQGIPFLHAGEELVRTKFGENNSYNLPDHFNQLDWTNKSKYYDVYTFYSKLIALRKNHPAFRMPTTSMIQRNLSFQDVDHPLVVGFLIANYANGDRWKNILVFYNADAEQVEVALPEGIWRVVASKFEINEFGVSTPGYELPVYDKALIPARSILILVDNESILRMQ